MGTELIGAFLKDADLFGAANITPGVLEDQVNLHDQRWPPNANALERTIIPDGQKYEDWLKSKEDAEGEKLVIFEERSLANFAFTEF